MTNPDKIVTRYAKVFLDHVVKNDRLEEVCKSVELLEETLVKCPSLIRLVLLNTATLREQKKGMLETICKKEVSPMLWRFIQLLVDQGKIAHLLDILQAFNTCCKEHLGIHKAILTTAVPPSPVLLKRFKKQAKEIISCKEIILEQRIDPTIIGGYILQVGTLKLDKSMKHQLHVLKTRCMGTVFTKPIYDYI
ncbi:MAG TPA: ATP synthase F1 subunit delta [Amoebophilaceae bacterium]|jgi:F-type H+-transporting ATPase subunit delta|nr:ATP synthase F1 subunit delta [Amoebophilaceae bacterium]